MFSLLRRWLDAQHQSVLKRRRRAVAGRRPFQLERLEDRHLLAYVELSLAAGTLPPSDRELGSWLQVTSAFWGASDAGKPGQQDGTKASLADFHFRLSVCHATPTLMQRCALGDPIKDIKLTLADTAPATQPTLYVTWTLSNAFISSYQIGAAVTPAADEIFTDKYGRLKVQFHWDDSPGNNAKSSCWVHLSQAWAGKQWGVMFLPRIGQEVIVDFLEGDPAQPIIVGSVYNAEFCVQYRETDFHFASRLMEEEGVYYFFSLFAGAGYDMPGGHSAADNLACAQGEHIAKATLDLCRAAADEPNYSKYEFSQVFITSVRPGGAAQGSDGVPLEEVSLNFATTAMSYVGHSGGDEPPSQKPEKCWDIVHSNISLSTHLDRPLVSPFELLHVSGYQPGELTQQFLVVGTFDQDGSKRALYELLKALATELPGGKGLAVIDKLIGLVSTAKNAKDPEQQIKALTLFKGCIGQSVNDTKASLIEFASFFDDLANLGGLLMGLVTVHADGLAKDLSAATTDPNNATAVQAVLTAVDVRIGQLRLQVVESKLGAATDQAEKDRLQQEKERLQNELKKLEERLQELRKQLQGNSRFDDGDRFVVGDSSQQTECIPSERGTMRPISPSYTAGGGDCLPGFFPGKVFQPYVSFDPNQPLPDVYYEHSRRILLELYLPAPARPSVTSGPVLHNPPQDGGRSGAGPLEPLPCESGTLQPMPAQPEAEPPCPPGRFVPAEGSAQPTESGAAAQSAAEAPAIAPPPVNRLVVGTDAGVPTRVNVFVPDTHSSPFSFQPYETKFKGGVRVATGDVNGDGVPDIITAPGRGRPSQIKVFDGANGQPLSGPLGSFLAFEPKFTGGVHVAAGDVNGDGVPDIITSRGSRGKPEVRVFSGADGTRLSSFFAYDTKFTGGVTVAAGDLNGDGVMEIITGPGAGKSGGHVKTFDGRTGALLSSFVAYASTFTGGVFVAAGDLNGDGKDEIITGAGRDTAHVKVFDAQTLTAIDTFFAAGPKFRGGVRVAVGDVNGDGKDDIITATGPGAAAQVRLWDGASLAALDSLFALDPKATGGVFVGVSRR